MKATSGSPPMEDSTDFVTPVSTISLKQGLSSDLAGPFSLRGMAAFGLAPGMV